MKRGAAIELAVLLIAAAWSLGFHLTLPSRLPTDSDYQAAADAIRGQLAAGDAVAVLPEWADRARVFMPGVPFVSAPELASADLSKVKRLWIIEIPSLPRADVSDKRERAIAHLNADGAAQQFGRLSVERFVNPQFREPLFDFTREVGRAQVYVDVPGHRVDCPTDGTSHPCGRGLTVAHEVREIDFAPYDCVGANPIGRNIPLVIEYPEAQLGAQLSVMAAVTGEMGWRHGEGQTPVELHVDIDGARAADLVVPVGTVPPVRSTVDTSKLDASAPHDVKFTVVTENPKDREFCFDARAD